MAEDEVIIKKSKLGVIRQHHDRIERLFDVQLSYFEDVSSLDGQVRLLLSSDQSQENIKKAKGFIFSLTSEGNEHRRVVKSYNSDTISMVQNQCDEIEQSSQAILQFLDNSNDLCIYGRPANVWKAQTLIDDMVVRTEPSFILESRTCGDYGNGAANVNVQSYTKRVSPHLCSQKSSSEYLIKESVDKSGGSFLVPDLSHLGSRDKHRDEDFECDLSSRGGYTHPSNHHEEGTSCSLGMNSTSLQIDGEVASRDFRDNVVKDEDSSRYPYRTPLYQFNSVDSCTEGSEEAVSSDITNIVPSLADLDFHNTSSSSDEERERLQNSVPDYPSKLEFAFKLGYTEDHLLVAVKKVGPKAGQNELLSELIKLGSCPIKSDDGQMHSIEQEEWSSDSFPSPFYNQLLLETPADGSNLRPIVIDGSNVAMSHGNKEIFSCQGIQLAVQWFRQRGHKEITVFVPQWRKEASRPDARIKDQEIMLQLEKEKVLVFTPARRIGGKRVVCYDDRYVLKLASETGGIVVSNDNYRDLLNESPEFRKVVEERLLMYSFVNDRFMPPDDPLGRHGPNLDNFLRKEPTQPETLPPLCPYGSKKCTYGNKCKYYHPERGNAPHKSITETLAEQAKQKIQDFRDRGSKDPEGEDHKKQTIGKINPKMSLTRTKSSPMGVESGNMTLSPIEIQRPRSADRLSGAPSEKEDTVAQKAHSDKWKEADEKLSACRIKMEMAEKEQSSTRSQEDFYNQNRGMNVLPTTSTYARDTSPSPFYNRSMSPDKTLSDEHRKPYPGHIDPMDIWSGSGAQNSGNQSSEQLHVPNQQPAREPLVSGHLLLAQKLSDEALDDSRSKLRNRGGASDQITVQQTNYMATEPKPMPAQQPKQRNHQKLCRQFSVRGDDDSRIRPSLHHTVSHDPRLLNPNYGYNTVFEPRTLLSQNQINRQDAPIFNQREPDRFSSYPFTGMEAARYQSYPHPGASRQASIADNYLFQNISTNDDVFVGDHMGLSRMQSAPIRHVEQESNRRMMSNMVRQNSSSDPQLHKTGDGDSFGQMSSRGTIPYPESERNSSIPPQYSQPLYMRSTSMMAPSYISSNQYSDTQRHFSDSRSFVPQNHPSQTGIGGSYHPSPSVVHQMSQNPFLSSSGGVVGQNLIMGHSQTQQAMAMPSAQSGHVMDIPFSQPGQNTTMTHSQMGHMTPMMGGGGQIVWSEEIVAPAKRAPIPDTSQILPNDPRYKLYYHLCGLFPEPKVRVVMNQHPDEMNPQELCAYIIGMK